MTLATLALMSYVGIVSLPTPIECRETFCEVWSEDANGLTCYDVDEVYPPGHYHFEMSPEFEERDDQNVGQWITTTELQAFVEY